MAITFRNATTATNDGDGGSLTINKPSGTADGDVLVLWLYSNGTQTSLSLSGWTRVGSGNSLAGLYYKTASSEPSSYTFDYGAGNELVACLAAFDGAEFSVAGYSEAIGNEEGQYLISDPGTITTGSVVVAVKSQDLTTDTTGYPVGDNAWFPSWTERAATTADNGVWTFNYGAQLATTAIGSEVTPGTLYTSSVFGLSHARGYVVLIPEGTGGGGGGTLAGSCGARAGVSATVAKTTALTGSCGARAQTSGALLTVTIITGRCGAVAGSSADVRTFLLDPLPIGAVAGCSAEVASATALAGTCGASAGVTSVVTTILTGRCGAVAGARGVKGYSHHTAIGIVAGVNDGDDNRNLQTLRTLAAINGGRLLGNPQAVSYTSLYAAKRLFEDDRV